ncbi:MAG TPA: AcrB/AcrD/AcrF family protein [Sphingomicrobium sp.]
MGEGKFEQWERRTLELIERHWKWVVVLVWLGFCGWFIFQKWSDIRFFGLGDTDDNMRIMQVRALLHGQGWYDLRNYRMNPPFGANIHWSRLVDLPIAGLILALRPFLGGAAAERWAVAVAPLLPYLLLLFSLALTARRLIAPLAYPLAFLALFFAGSTNGMFMPERIDHHGWQLALLALSIAAIADPQRVRGGIVLGVSSALSLAIGLEMIIYLALAGVAMVLFWIDDVEERERLEAYALSLTAAVGLCYLGFVSYDNRNPVCDALSPVWLSDAVLGGALMYALAWLSPADRKRRLVLALVAGAIIAAFHVLTWPHCIQRLEGVSPEVERLWLSHVKEARPVYMHGWRIATLIVALPITGAIGWLVLLWLRRSDAALRRRVLGAAVPGFAASLLLLWQTRTGPAAQMMATVGAAALVWFMLPLAWRSKMFGLRVAGAALVVIAGAGAAVPFVLNFIPETKPTPYEAKIGRANGLCGSLWGLHPVALQPKGMVFTFVDLGPRLIAVTHHDTVVGPYHRNGQQIADVMNAWRGSADQAHRIMVDKYRSNYVLSCPDSSTTTIFMSEAPQGFYGQLQRGQVPKWLQPVPLPKDSPYRMWKVVA